jgi:Zn-dependent peptidase ImmA (M78 family)/transcriptional regulator with XRE-family HTH domain
MPGVAAKPELLRWARERAGLAVSDLAKRFPKLEAWERGEAKPTLKQLENFAKVTHAPFGYLFLPEPPPEPLPIPDFRTVAQGERPERPSPDLLETIYAMQRRQAWLRETLIEGEADRLAFVGSARLKDDPEAIGHEMRRLAGFDDGWAREVGTWQEAVSRLRRAIEDLGVMAVINGVVGNNTHRKLDVAEFRGFALSDPYAPLIFVNGADAKSAQMFTLAHELAHLWVGAEGLSGFDALFPGGSETEAFCDKAAAEFLVPKRELRACWNEVKREERRFEALARRFKVSPIVAGRRAMDLRLVGRDAFFDFYRHYTVQERRRSNGAGGGDFYNNQKTRVGTLLGLYVVRAAMEGRVTFKEAYELTGLRGGAFQEFAHRLGATL